MAKAKDEAAAECNHVESKSLQLQPTGAQKDGPGENMDAPTNPEDYAEQWAGFARLLDRFFFLLYMCLMLFGALGFLLLTIIN